jgi:HEPN domain-containing protein
MEQMRQYGILYKKAKTDLKVSKNLLEDFNNGDDELDMETIMFHLQQSAEKLLKSLLAYNNKNTQYKATYFEHGVTVLDLIFNEGSNATKFMKSFE